MGSRITSQARASRPRRLAEGSSFGPCACSRATASFSEMPLTVLRSISGSMEENYAAKLSLSRSCGEELATIVTSWGRNRFRNLSGG
jgi:hypothetical protein